LKKQQSKEMNSKDTEDIFNSRELFLFRQKQMRKILLTSCFDGMNKRPIADHKRTDSVKRNTMLNSAQIK